MILHHTIIIPFYFIQYFHFISYDVFILFYFVGESDANMAGIISSDPERGGESGEIIL